MTGNGSDRARFGPFEVDLHTHELWKFGTRIRLVGQPFEILAVLLSRPGELVTREELRTRLWPADTFVDFNHGLNAAVNKLREALSDSAENPRYIETLPRRGYLSSRRWNGSRRNQPGCRPHLRILLLFCQILPGKLKSMSRSMPHQIQHLRKLPFGAGSLCT